MQRLAEAVHVPMGIEVLPPTAFPSHDDRPSLTGLTLRDALDVLAAIDPRYSWREMDGVIVFRPVDAWNDASSPLFRLVPGFKADDVPLSRVVGLLMARLGDEGHIRNYLPDTRPISIDLPQGTVLDALNRIALRTANCAGSGR